MPSTLLFTQSGGIGLVSGAVLSGFPWNYGGIQLRLSNSGAGPIYVCLPNLSGSVSTAQSGGVLSSGGLSDGMEVDPGDSYYVPKGRLVSGVETIRLIIPAASSGGRLFWEPL